MFSPQESQGRMTGSQGFREPEFLTQDPGYGTSPLGIHCWFMESLFHLLSASLHR